MTRFRQSTRSQLPAYQYVYGDKTASGVCLQNVTDYSPFGAALDGRTMQQGDGYRYGFQGQEEVREVKSLPGTHYTSTFWEYDPRAGRRFNLDPVFIPWQSVYSTFNNNPLRFKDPDGRNAVDMKPPSTHLDDEGKVIAVFNDGDNGVYQHSRNADGGKPTEYMLTRRADKYGTSSGGKKVGKTEYWDEFVSPETGKTMTNYKLQLGKSFDPIVSRMHSKADDMDLIEIAMASRGGGLFDIKKDYPNVGGLLNGKYATSRSAGNFLAGYNAESGTYAGVSISFITFQKLAGALHIEESNGKKLDKLQMIDIVIFGTYISSEKSKFKSPAWGEVIYQYRMSKAGWDYGSKK